jgi:hypothetical protein
MRKSAVWGGYGSELRRCTLLRHATDDVRFREFDYVLFQPTITSLAVPLAAFSDPDRAIAAIKAKLAQSGFRGGEK